MPEYIFAYADEMLKEALKDVKITGSRLFSAIMLPIGIGIDILVEKEPVAQAVFSQTAATIGGIYAYKYAFGLLTVTFGPNFPPCGLKGL